MVRMPNEPPISAFIECCKNGKKDIIPSSAMIDDKWLTRNLFPNMFT